MGCAPYRIVLVEDHADTLAVITRLLRHEGHEVSAAATLADAVRLCEQPFDILLSDLTLPDGNGAQLLKQVRRQFPGTCCIAMTGHAMEEDIQKIHDAGFDFYLIKPFAMEKLAAIIDACATVGN